jgi:hypothetical protein
MAQRQRKGNISLNLTVGCYDRLLQKARQNDESVARFVATTLLRALPHVDAESASATPPETLNIVVTIGDEALEQVDQIRARVGLTRSALIRCILEEKEIIDG